MVISLFTRGIDRANNISLDIIKYFRMGYEFTIDAFHQSCLQALEDRLSIYSGYDPRSIML